VIWKDLDSLEERCLLCRETKPRQDLDRLLWCDACVADAKARALSRSWCVGSAIAVVLALWIWLYVQPSDMLIGGWIGTVVAALYVSARVAREVLYGVARFRGEAAHLEATPTDPAE
jgi:hypothetical protein